jgi:hypothetical protein
VSQDIPPFHYSLCLNLNTNRPDLQPFLNQLNPILANILSILENYPDTTGEGSLSTNFSKILFSKIGTS